MSASIQPLKVTLSNTRQRIRAKLARDHAMTLEVAESELTTAYHRITDSCNQPSTHCTILYSELASGRDLAAQIRMRVAPDEVAPLRQLATQLGALVRQTTHAEDLTDAIADTDGRLNMARDYRQKLLDLQAKSDNNVDAAIKIAAELSRVQNELEQTDAERTGQQVRIDTELLNINLQTPGIGTVLHPIRDAFRDFRSNLSSGIAQVVVGVAYIVPWLTLIIPALLGIRRLWQWASLTRSKLPPISDLGN